MGYERMHQRLAGLYAQELCPHCHTEIDLKRGEGGKERITFESLLNAFRRVFKRQRMTPEMLRERPIREAIDATAQVLTEAISPVLEYTGTPPAMQQSLREDVYIFSGFKTYHELREASALLIDERGQLKPFERYLQDVRKIHERYNRAYLEAEYIYAVSAAEAAREWQKLKENGSLDEYDLQYRTAADGRVRPDHVTLHGITLPGRDPFWDLFYPPNGWRCRCVVRRVIPGMHERTPSEIAMQAGMAATGGKNSIFRMNPGKQAVIFPRNHPYYGKQGYGHCITGEGSTELKQQPIGSKEVCKVYGELRKSLDEEKPQTLKEADKVIKEWSKQNRGEREVAALQTGRLSLRLNSVKRFLGHARSIEMKMLLTILDENPESLQRTGDTIAVGAGKDMSDTNDEKNVREKKKRNVIGYNKYEVEVNGVVWIFGLELVKKGNSQAYEQPYYIAKKRG